MKLLFVVQRYGIEVDGGAELYCRWLAERTSRHHAVTVLTTTAKDYITWANDYPCGESLLGGVPVIRMPVVRCRDMESFNRLTDRVLMQPENMDLQEQWVREQGPWSPGLLEYLKSHHAEFDFLIFVTYLYAPTVCGIRIAPDKSLLIPTAHDEPVAHLPIFTDVFQQPRGLMYLTGPEKEFVARTFHLGHQASLLLGTGIELPDSSGSAVEVLEKYKIGQPYLIYMGRIEPGKGCDHLVRFFQSYRRTGRHNPTLILAGRLHMDLPDDPSIRYIGFVPDSDIRLLLSSAAAVIVPSPFESLSILLLQAFACSRPVIANSASDVLTEHCRLSNGGLYYADESEFTEALDLVLNHPSLGRSLGENGCRYIQDYFTWDKVMSRLDDFLQNLAGTL